MKKSWKKWMTLWIAGAVIVAVLAGCGQNETKDPNQAMIEAYLSKLLTVDKELTVSTGSFQGDLDKLDAYGEKEFKEFFTPKGYSQFASNRVMLLTSQLEKELGPLTDYQVKEFQISQPQQGTGEKLAYEYQMAFYYTDSSNQQWQHTLKGQILMDKEGEDYKIDAQSQYHSPPREEVKN